MDGENVVLSAVELVNWRMYPTAEDGHETTEPSPHYRKALEEYNSMSSSSVYLIAVI